MGKVKDFIRKPVWVVVIVVMMIAVFMVIVNVKNKAQEDSTAIIYNYNRGEQRLAEAVKEYLAQYLILTDKDSSKVADVAVKSYNTVLSSGITDVTSEYTAALERNVRYALESCLAKEQITDEDFNALSSGICQVIWNTILSQIEDSSATGALEFEEQYLTLTESLQEQIDELKEKSTEISIRAKINSGSSPSTVDDESFLSGLLGTLKGETLNSVGESLADAKEEILDEVGSSMDVMRQQISSEMDSRYGNIKDGKNGSDGRNGVDGKNGENGKDGAVGKNGKDGAAGADGKTTYFAYAEDEYGTGFSLTPTENSKYIGSCLSASSQQPTDPIQYGEWSLYKGEDGKDGKDGTAGTDGKTTYIAYAEDAHGTGFSLTPTENSRYIGSCLSASDSQPDDAGEYEWQEYRTYILSVTTDENNVTTLHIR